MLWLIILNILIKLACTFHFRNMTHNPLPSTTSVECTNLLRKTCTVVKSAKTTDKTSVNAELYLTPGAEVVRGLHFEYALKRSKSFGQTLMWTWLSLWSVRCDSRSSTSVCVCTKAHVVGGFHELFLPDILCVNACLS